MNTAEKIAATHLRLNGFLLLPHFTAFDGVHHGHVDMIGLRAQGSAEIVNGNALLIDNDFFTQSAQVLHIDDPKSILLGVIAEVKTPESPEHPNEEHVAYVK